MTESDTNLSGELLEKEKAKIIAKYKKFDKLIIRRPNGVEFDGFVARVFEEKNTLLIRAREYGQFTLVPVPKPKRRRKRKGGFKRNET